MSIYTIKKKVAEDRMKILLPQYEKAIKAQDLATGKKLITDIQSLLKTLSKTIKLVELRNALFEVAMEQGEYSYAIEGFTINRSMVNRNTKLHLEATVLLAVCYIRNEQFIEAQPIISEALKNEKVIKDKQLREKFHIDMINRFNEESVLMSLMTKKRRLEEDINEITNQVLLIEQTRDTEDIFQNIGKVVPLTTKNILFTVDQFSKNQLSYTEQKKLPSPEEVVKDEAAGRTVFSCFKRVLYRSLCDPESDVYKAWYTNGIGSLHDKKVVIGIVAAGLANIGVAKLVLIASVAALAIRFGLDIYCEKFKPAGVMEQRHKKVRRTKE